MHLSNFVAAFAAVEVGLVLAVPLPQANKIGAGASDVLTGADNGIGYGIENAGANVGNAEQTGLEAVGSSVRRRSPQANKIGAGASDVLTGADNGIGYGIEDASANVGNAEQSDLEAIGSSVKKRSPQANKIGAGASDILTGADNGVGYGVENAGANIQTAEQNDLETAGSSVRRQLANTGYGVAAFADGVDTGVGQGSQDALTNAGTLVATEGVAAGNAVPSKRSAQLANTGYGVAALSDGVDSGLGAGATQEPLTNAGTLIGNEGVAVGNAVPAKRSPQLANTGYGVAALSDGIDTGLGAGATQEPLTNAGTLIGTEGVAVGNAVPAKA